MTLTQEVTIETITPDAAQAMLAHSDFHNRRLRNSVVERYAAEMRNGEWKLTPEPIVFDTAGNLFQGQHRLQAVIRADRPVDFLVIRDWDPDVFDVLDSGVKRTVADALQSEGVGWQASVVAAAGKLMAALDMPDTAGGVHTRAKQLTRSSVIHYANDHIEELEWAATLANKVYRSRAVPAASNTAIACASILISRVSDFDTVEQFFGDIADGNLPVGDPRWALLRWNPTAKQSGMAQNIRSIAAILKCWNGYATGRPVRTLAWRSQSEKFPVAQSVQSSVFGASVPPDDDE